MRVIVMLVLLVGFVAGPATATPSDCIGQSPDGRAICLPPELTRNSVHGCIANNLLVTENATARCMSRIGAFGAPIYEDGPWISLFNCVASELGYPGRVSALAWQPKDVSINSYLCWSGTVTHRWGEEIRGYSANYMWPSFYDVFAIRSKSAACRPGETTVRDAAGEVDHCRPPVDVGRSCPVGNPALPDSGIKTERSADYEGAGAHALRFERIYRSWWHPRRPGAGLGPNWTHNWAASVYAPAGNVHGTHYAVVIRPDGELHYFHRTSSAAAWLTSNGSRQALTELTDGSGARSGWRLHVFDDDSIETYTTDGKLLSVAARNGWLTTLGYSDTTTPAATAPGPGYLVRVRNQFGRELRFVYDAYGRVSEFLVPGAVAGTAAGSAASPIRYAYNEAASLGAGVPVLSQLTSVTWQDGTVRRYRHESYNPNRPIHAELLTGITDEAGVRYATFTYKSHGKIASSEHIGGVDRAEFAYHSEADWADPGPNFGAVNVTDYPGGSWRSRVYSFTTVGNTRLPSAVSAPCSLCGNTYASYGYDGAGNLVRAVGHEGKVTFYQYDAKRRETERALFPAAYNTATSRPALSLAERVVSTSWHPTFNLPAQITSPKRYLGFTYDAKGNIALDSDTDTTDATGASKFNAVRIDSTRKRTYWTYNTASLPTTIRQTTGGDGNGVGAVETGRWTLAYNATGDVTQVTDVPTGKSATLTSDASGQITRIDASNGAVASFLPNTRGRMIKAVTPDVTTDFTIDARGLINEIRFSDGRWIQYTHNAAHRLIKIVDNTGQVEQYAGIEPKWFIDESTIRTAAAWLSLRGKRLSSLIISDAQAVVPALAIPAGVVLGLFVIVDTARRSGSSGAASGRCCGQDGPPGSIGADDGGKSSWAQQVAMLLSGQTAPPPATPAPVYDKAGLLVSPKACIPPPGNCDPNKYDQLKNDVDAKCGVPRACIGGMPQSELTANLEKQRACAIARDKINKTCFAGGDLDHRDQAIDAWKGVARCEHWLSRL